MTINVVMMPTPHRAIPFRQTQAPETADAWETLKTVESLILFLVR